MNTDASTSNGIDKKQKEQLKYVTFDNEFYPQNNGEISNSITQNWTEQAVECYRLKCDCSLCSISKGQYSFVCQMPKVLDILMKAGINPSLK